jgi:tetratricopeptide (TPR) repeat protein
MILVSKSSNARGQVKNDNFIAITDVLMTNKPVKTNAELIAEAKDAESADNLEAAVLLYEEAIKAEPVNESAYNRLMIIYRKQKEYRKELKVIKAAVKAYEQFYKSKSTHSKSRKIAEISNALLKSTGLADKKGNHLYEPEPIGTWKKRKLLVEKKLK